ncbi:MAG: hypothetical protein HOI42_13890 [Candidatus Marinimicrobia bacterium]|jgi:hypothetical protein|nr:hypothetical protein [Candidatus Neomarinimicrobiota bacterium]
MACTFRPSKDAEKAIEKIKRDHGLKTNSKALEYVLVIKNESDLAYKNMVDQLHPNKPIINTKF